MHEDRLQRAVALLHELSEALTATGSYLTAAVRVHAAAAESEPTLAKILDRGLDQLHRANETVRRLRDLIHIDMLRDEGSV